MTYYYIRCYVPLEEPIDQRIWHLIIDSLDSSVICQTIKFSFQLMQKPSWGALINQNLSLFWRQMRLHNFKWIQYLEKKLAFQFISKIGFNLEKLNFAHIIWRMSNFLYYTLWVVRAQTSFTLRNNPLKNGHNAIRHSKKLSILHVNLCKLKTSRSRLKPKINWKRQTTNRKWFVGAH